MGHHRDGNRGDNAMSKINTGSGEVTYEAIRNAMNGESFIMSLTDTDEIKAVIAAVNEGIDAHLS
jgi:hypothetical protein